MDEHHINICQVSLKRDIPLIIKNFENFKKFYKKIKIYIICPSQDFLEFKNNLDFKEFIILKEDALISLVKFEEIFKSLSENISYETDFKKRIKWYYQQVLKISFILKFIIEENKKIIIWDADTIILNKINFFENDHSILYGNFNEFHRPYYDTNKEILKNLPSYYISFLNQFIAITVREGKFLIDKILGNEKKNICENLSKKILQSIFLVHKKYNGSMFSEYELIGQTNNLLNKKKQKPILTLRFGLNGILTKHQNLLVKILNFKHVTYEHSHQNIDSVGMLNRKQSWSKLIKIMIKNLVKFYLRYLKHNFKYMIKKNGNC